MKLTDLQLRLRALFRGQRVEQELEGELRDHLELQVRKYISQGFTEPDARRKARIDFGGMEQVREQCRDVRGTQSIESIWRDFKYAFRTLAKSPGFTLTAALALAIGMGANVALLHSFLSALKPTLPFRDADRLAVLWLKNKKDPSYDEMMMSIPNLAAWRERAHSFTSIAATTWTENMNFGGGDQAERIRAFEVTANLFETLGIQPRQGRAFLEGEQHTGRNRVAILGHGFCLRHFGAPDAALAKSIRLDGESYTVVGILPPDFFDGFLPQPDVLIPLAIDTQAALDRGRRMIVGLGRLRDGVSIEAGQSELAAIEEQLGREDPEDAGWTVNATLLPAEGTKDARDKLPFFAAIALIVLLLACTNSASLSLARYLVRRSEMSVRSALGASRARLAQQILCEGLLLSIFAGLLGFAVALGGISLIRQYEPFYSTFPIAPIPDWRIFVCYAFLIGGVALLFGSAPALTVSRSAIAQGLNLGSTRISESRGRLATVSMTFQIGVAVAVLCVTGLMGRTLVRLYHFDLGFTPDRLLEGEVVLKGSRYVSPSAQRDFFDRLTERIESDHRIHAALISHFPLSNSYGMAGYPVYREDQPRPAQSTLPMTSADAVSSNFFSLAGAKLVRGRDFRTHEEEPVGIINESFARKYFPNEDPIGKRLVVLAPMMKEIDELAPGPRRIIGVVHDITRWGPRSPPWPNLYVPFDQNPVPWMSVIVDGPGADLIKSSVAALDPDIPIFRIHTARELMDETFAPSRFQLMMLGVFSLVAIFLSAIGVFSMLAQSVRRRRREFGIRLALGATPAQVRSLALRGGLAVAAAGLTLGLGIAAILGRLMASLLYDVKPWDAQVACASVVLVIASVACACLLPANEASRTDPLSAVRDV